MASLFQDFSILVPQFFSHALARLQYISMPQAWHDNLLWLLSPTTFPAFTLAVGIILFILISRRKAVYLVDYVCFITPMTSRVPFSTFIEHSTLAGFFNEKTLQFQKLILERSGVGECTTLPRALHYLPPRPTLTNAREESEMVIFEAMGTLFQQTRVRPEDIGILVVNCSLFSPVPSLCSMIINKFKMRDDIKSFNLSGMGCSAGVISVGLAKSLLRVHNDCYAIVVSTENITQNWYCGNRRSMVIPNCLFRVGGATILLSNKTKDTRRSKYKLQHVVRTLTGADDKSYRCVYQEQDEEGHTGVTLSKDLTKVAGDALRKNITSLGPLVLPLSEQLAFVFAKVAKEFFNPKLKGYIPDFKRAFDHFCIHAGGRAVIDELEKSLELSPEQVEASRMTLHRFANTSSSSIWYELSYLEAKGRMKPGQRVWQIAFGSGFKCNSAVWTAMPGITAAMDHKKLLGNPWMGCIDEYPVDLKSIE